MIHPDTHLRVVSPQVGYGVYASQPIPAGTMTYVRDAMEVAIERDSPMLHDPVYGPIIERFAYTDPNGTRIVSWDIGKYMNHCCQANTLSTGFGFEIAIRDIAAGEQITDDYGMFNIDQPMTLICDNQPCRGVVDARDFDQQVPMWERKVRAALKRFNHVQQPLLGILDQDTHRQLMTYLSTGRGYRSVAELNMTPTPGTAAGSAPGTAAGSAKTRTRARTSRRRDVVPSTMAQLSVEGASLSAR